jgi:hypothetical protein
LVVVWSDGRLELTRLLLRPGQDALALSLRILPGLLQHLLGLFLGRREGPVTKLDSVVTGLVEDLLGALLSVAVNLEGLALDVQDLRYAFLLHQYTLLRGDGTVTLAVSLKRF